MPISHGHQNNDGGINICCCRICTCLHLEFLTSKNGILKLCEVILGSMCQTLLIRFGMPYANDIGQAFSGFLTTVASCLTTATILLICYVLSSKTFHLLRQSLFVSLNLLLFFSQYFNNNSLFCFFFHFANTPGGYI